MAGNLIPKLVNNAIASDLAQQTKEYQATIARLKVARERSHTCAAKIPLERLLIMPARGDSWFDYSLDRNGITIWTTDVIAQLTSMGTVSPVILNIAHHGDATAELPRAGAADIVGTGERLARRVVSALLEHGVLISESTRAPLRLAFPAKLASRRMPGLFPERLRELTIEQITPVELRPRIHDLSILKQIIESPGHSSEVSPSSAGRIGAATITPVSGSTACPGL
jgi:hypothetical protein